MKEEILKMVNICKQFGGVQALKNAGFSCHKGEVHVLLGENGAGKSTILKILSGLYRADKGSIILNGKQVEFKNPNDAQRAGIGMVYQELTLLPEMTVSQNIFLNCEPVNKFGVVDKKEIYTRIEEMIQKYKIQVDPDAVVGKMPIAKQQMVEILKMLVRNPEIIILDEPTSCLSKQEVDKLYEIIHSLISAGKTIIFISHRLEEIFHIGDRITILKDGELVTTRLICELDSNELIKLMVGRPLQNIFPQKNDIHSETNIFEVKNLSIKGILKDISFNVKKGEIIGIAALQGHGQTELLKSLAGILQWDSGEIYINSEPLKLRNPAQAIHAGIAFVPEDRKNLGLLQGLSIRENISLASNHLRQKFGYVSIRKERAFVSEYIKKLSIKTASQDIPVSSLSGGNQQKVVLGKELAINPKVLLFNEPTRGIDVETKREFYFLMRELAQKGIAVIMYSSDLLEVIGMSDRIIVMYEGSITGVLDKDDLCGSDDSTKNAVCEEKIMRYAMGIGD